LIRDGFLIINADYQRITECNIQFLKQRYIVFTRRGAFRDFKKLDILVMAVLRETRKGDAKRARRGHFN